MVRSQYGKFRMNPNRAGLRERVRSVFPNQVKKARKQSGLSQREIAAELQRLGLAAAGGGVVSDWERGKAFPKFETFLALCEILNQPPAFFFGDRYEVVPKPTRDYGSEILREVKRLSREVAADREQVVRAIGGAAAQRDGATAPAGRDSEARRPDSHRPAQARGGR